jgi:uncharacterized membrane protein
MRLANCAVALRVVAAASFVFACLYQDSPYSVRVRFLEEKIPAYVTALSLHSMFFGALNLKSLAPFDKG